MKSLFDEASSGWVVKEVARHFGSSVHFMVTDYQPWFAHKYNHILTQLSRYQVIDTTLNASDHCFPGAVVGLKYQGNLALNPDSIPGGHTMLEFKELLIFLSQEEGTTSSAYRGKPKYDVSSDPTLRITTTTYYSRKASNWILEDSCPDYMFKVYI
uniref:Uncharacterized protein n=1 Tax=Lactuca sativa TaxID=4236 RepID=A0A9R1VY75_LACSA|nr:hypothetical protein LSAT_V11C300127690 [Lactuca sativa]